MKTLLRFITLCSLLCLAGPAAAQYLKITTDNPNDNTRLRPSGTTILTITLNTNHDRNASLQTCNSHTAANGCGSTPTAAVLDMFSYTLALKATGGTVTWGTFTPSDAAYTDAAPLIFSSTEIEINKARPSGTLSPAGLNSIGTIPVTPASGSPWIGLQIGPGALNPFGFGTGFGTDCDGFAFPNTYVVGDPADPCGNTNGVPGDWFDWDGAAAAALPASPPVLTVASTASASEGSTFAIPVTATDPDAGDVLTITVSGHPSDIVPAFPISGPSPLSGTLTGTPGFNDAGTYTIQWTASDNHGLSTSRSTTLVIANTNRPPTLNAIANMTVSDGATKDQAISGSDPDGDALTFSKAAGPTFMTVTTVTATTGSIHLAPGFADDGTYSATARASDGALSDTKAFTITVGGPDRAPVLNPIANMNVAAGGCGGSTADQAISGSDPDGDALTFSIVAGPTFMTVTTNTPTTGNIHLAPGFSDRGGYGATVRASDGTLSDSKSFSITVSTVNQAPVLSQPANMTVTEGATADQTLTGSDPCGAALTFTKVSGPTFVTVTTVNGTTGNVHLAPGFSDAGTYSVFVQASNGSLSGSKGFTITVSGMNRAPTLFPVSNMIVPESATRDQAITGSDPDGDALAFSKVAGPTYMSVTTTSPTTGNIHLAPGFADAGTAGATVRASDGSLNADGAFTITVCDGCQSAPVLAAIADMTVTEGGTADQNIVATDADGNALAFSKTAGPVFMTVTTISPGTGTASGNIHLAPVLSDAGAYSATVSVSDGSLTSSRVFSITVLVSRAPVLNPIAGMTVTEGMTADQTITATDADGSPITFSKVSGPIFMTVSTTNPGTGTASGNIHLAPGLADAGAYLATVSASTGPLTDNKSFQIGVLTSGNRCPVANPGGPYTGLVGSIVTFDGSASSDPDGNPLTYSWDFDESDGITREAVGAVVTHIYPAAGVFTVNLAVTDNGDGDPNQICTASATTTATITVECPGTVFNGYDTIRLGSGKPFWFAYVQPTSGCYANTDVITSSFVLKYAGKQVPAEATKTSIGGDKSGDGIQEIKVSWPKENLRTLFSGTGLSNGHNTVIVTLEAALVGGGLLRGTTQLDVVNNGSFTISAVAPNPLNPEATLTYTTSKQGPVRIDMFDVQGRLVRRLVDASAVTAGVHDVKIDGRGERGEKLPSGVYYIRGTSSEGAFEHLVTILK
ncbi:MAG TPA: Ig-like domain-containing protein [Candidatus Binatia bacterium]|nr:Ig-like domain-containing protein [Candidatus Binatia bacterium]